MKKIISIICIIAMLLSVPVLAAGSPTVTIDSVSAQAGETVEIAVRIDGNANTGLANFETQIAYDAALQIRAIKKGPAFASLTFADVRDLSQNPVTLCFDGLDADYGEGVIAVITFAVPQDSGEYRIAANRIIATDQELNPVTISTVAGGITVASILSSVELNGSLTTPVKNAVDQSSLTGSGVTANVTWSPALENGRFAQNTVYTATVTVSPAQDASFAERVNITPLDGFSPFTKNAAGNYVATRTFERTSDKDAPIAEAPTGLTATYGDRLGSVTLANAPGNTAGSWTWKAGDAASVGNAGTQTHVAVFTPENTNDYAVVETPLTIEVSKAPLTLTAATVADKTYNGRTDDAKVTAVTLGGLVNGETLALGTDYTAAGVYATADAGDSVDVTVTVALKDTARANNYTLSGATVAATGKVSKTTTTLSLKAADAVYTGLAYDAANITRTSNVETAPAYTYYADNNGAKGTALDAAPVNVGTYWVEGAIAATTNNSAVTSEAVKFSITRAPLIITAKDHTVTYGAAPANDGVEYAGFVNGETADVVSGLSYTYSYEQYANVGAYAINLTGATSDNYQITLKSGKLTVAQKAVGLTWSRYEDLFYDGQAKAVTAAATGLVNDDAVSVTVAGGAQKDAGSYTAKATGLTGAKAANYKLPDTGLTQAYTIAYALERVTAAPATVTATVDQSSRTVRLAGYVGEDAEIALTDAEGNPLTVTDGKITANGVEYNVDMRGVVVNESSTTLTETAPQVTKPEDAEESITDAVVTELSDPATGSSGLDSAGAAYIFGAAARDETIDAVEVSLSIQPVALTGSSLKLEITPIVTYKSGSDTVKIETLPNSAIKAPVTISVKLPAGMPTTGLIAKHSLGGGKFEFLAVTVINGVAVWQQSSFSEVELISDSRSATVNFTFENGSGRSVTYTAADIGRALPTDSKSGSSFLGWLVDGGVTAENAMTDALLTALDGRTVEAVPSFRTNGAWNPGGAVTMPVEPVNPFVDVFETDYSYDAVLWAVEQEITAGVSATRFAPNDTCTRAQAVTFLWRAAGEPKAVNTVNPFEDVTATDYYYDAVLWAVEQGIAAGVSETRFAPGNTVTRGQMMTFLWRMAGKPDATAGTAFTDVAADSYYAPAVAWAVAKGITLGVSAKAFAPDANCTRGQIVTFLYRNMGK